MKGYTAITLSDNMTHILTYRDTEYRICTVQKLLVIITSSISIGSSIHTSFVYPGWVSGGSRLGIVFQMSLFPEALSLSPPPLSYTVVPQELKVFPGVSSQWDHLKRLPKGVAQEAS